MSEIKRVLIANRGAIAVRIQRTLHEMAIESIAIYAEADRESLHVRQADHVFSLGEGSARETYLDQQKILDIAKEAKADAIHPGYGFLSENTDFVSLCERAGIAFIGPTSNQIKAFGLKHSARELAESQSTPLLPGTGVLSGLSEAKDRASEIGYPLMLKSSAGGGGIGMQLCRDQDELVNAYASVAQLSQNNFSSDELFLEKFVERARHIEVQIFGDGQGNVIALGERDCSAQRRNQKVIEETPAPNLRESTRARLNEVAIKLTSAVNYRSAGTVEFILDADTEEFYFLEVNTRLQVEHGVTEEIFGVDIVHWMIELAAGLLPALPKDLEPQGHAVQARVYAEDPAKNFQPSAGILSHVSFPERNESLRIDHWIESGIEVSAFFDPMLAKVIFKASDRRSALEGLYRALDDSEIYGIETNVLYLKQLLKTDAFQTGHYVTSTLAGMGFSARTLEILQAGTLTTIQDYPGRRGYWDVGVPPSGPFDSRSFRLGNRLLGNMEGAAGLEMTMNGVGLRFNCDTQIVLAGARMPAKLDDQAVNFWQVIDVNAGQELHLGAVDQSGIRTYLLFAGGIQCPDYLGSKSTFTLGGFGGHAGRALRTGDVLHIGQQQGPKNAFIQAAYQLPEVSREWLLHVVPGPQGAPDFFTREYLEVFYNHDWEVHFNSSRTGVRLIGPKPEWARTDGGEAGMHPSNIHDNAYAFGTIDFTGDMPVILGPDGPSLGGFVCPATVTTADLWKIGQLKAGDKVRFIPVTLESAVEQYRYHTDEIADQELAEATWQISDSLDVFYTDFSFQNVDIRCRRAGDSWVLVEFGDMVLDIELRFFVHRLMVAISSLKLQAVLELTPGIRSLQIHYDCLLLSESDLLRQIQTLCEKVISDQAQTVPSRIIHLPLSWDDEHCRLAIEKYHQGVRKDAPWYPSNIEFIRRINGLDSLDSVKKIVFDASYLVMGLGDVYLGAPVATPLDPRHRLVTTKYNPARTWTAENSVGIGGSYLCIYGMEGPGGYQFVGRTLQMWNRYRKTSAFDKPWLLEFFDQIRFYEVSEEELKDIRKQFPLGTYPIRIEETEFSLDEYKTFLNDNQTSIDTFVHARQQAFDQELERWKDQGQLHFEERAMPDVYETEDIPEGTFALQSPVAGSVWKLLAEEGDNIEKGQVICVLESMKMEVEICSPDKGVLQKLNANVGSTVQAAANIAYIERENEP